MTGDEIKQARRRLGLTQAEFAKVMGFTGKSYVSRIETAPDPLSRTSIRLLNAYLEGYRPRDWPVGK